MALLNTMTLLHLMLVCVKVFRNAVLSSDVVISIMVLAKAVTQCECEPECLVSNAVQM